MYRAQSKPDYSWNHLKFLQIKLSHINSTLLKFICLLTFFNSSQFTSFLFNFWQKQHLWDVSRLCLHRKTYEWIISQKRRIRGFKGLARRGVERHLRSSTSTSALIDLHNAGGPPDTSLFSTARFPSRDERSKFVVIIP